MTHNEDSTAILAKLIRWHRITSLRYFEAAHQPPVQALLTLKDQQAGLVTRALRLRARTGIPFIESLLLQMLRHGPQPTLLAAVGRHYPYRARTLRLGGAPLTVLRQLMAHRNPARMLVVSSHVTVHGNKSRHIPMLDFRFAPSPLNLRVVTAVL